MNEKLQSLLLSIQESAEKFGDTAADAAYGVGKKAESLLSTAKLNIKIADLKGQISQQLKAVGEMIYGTHTGNPTESEVLLNKLEEIDGLYAQIAELEALLGRQPAPAACPDCGKESREGDVFCRDCGRKL